MKKKFRDKDATQLDRLIVESLAKNLFGKHHIVDWNRKIKKLKKVV